MSLWSKCRRIVLAIAVVLAVGGLLQLYRELVTAPPLEAPISLQPAGVVTQAIWVLTPDNFRLALGFQRSQETTDVIRKFVGYDLPTQPGLPTPMRWSLQDSQGRTVASGKTAATGSDAGSAAETRRTITHLRLEPGRYQFRAELMAPVPELGAVDTRLRLSVDPKAPTSWQFGIAGFWVPMFTHLLAPAMLLVLLGFLLITVLLHFRPPPAEPLSAPRS